MKKTDPLIAQFNAAPGALGKMAAAADVWAEPTTEEEKDWFRLIFRWQEAQICIDVNAPEKYEGLHELIEETGRKFGRALARGDWRLLASAASAVRRKKEHPSKPDKLRLMLACMADSNNRIPKQMSEILDALRHEGYLVTDSTPRQINRICREAGLEYDKPPPGWRKLRDRIIVTSRPTTSSVVVRVKKLSPRD